MFHLPTVYSTFHHICIIVIDIHIYVYIYIYICIYIYIYIYIIVIDIKKITATKVCYMKSHVDTIFR